MRIIIIKYIMTSSLRHNLRNPAPTNQRWKREKIGPDPGCNNHEIDPLLAEGACIRLTAHNRPVSGGTETDKFNRWKTKFVKVKVSKDSKQDLFKAATSVKFIRRQIRQVRSRFRVLLNAV